MQKFKSQAKYIEEVDDGSILEEIWKEFKIDRKNISDCVAIWLNVN